jgi:Mrp family chromosome partitioning ATPase
MTSTELSKGSSDPRVETATGKAADNGWYGRRVSSMRSPSDADDEGATGLEYARVDQSPLLDQLPASLVESLRYLVGRFQLGDTVQFSPRVAVVSALHGEGVTTISRTLAAILASDLDARVCCIDLSWPGQPTQRSNEASDEGIYEVVTGKLKLAAVLQPTEDARLTFLSVGQVPDSQRQVLARSPLLGNLFDELDLKFDYMVFDMPPILAGSAGLGLVRYVNSYLLVVRHGVTTTHQMRSAVDELRSIPSVGVVLNRYKSRIPKWLANLLAS